MDTLSGLRVLVIDGDQALLNNLERVLKKYNYNVVTCRSTLEALSRLERAKDQDGFDLVMCDDADIHALNFLDRVAIGMDLPVIMMSTHGGTNKVREAYQHGACHHLRKPVRMKELRDIWHLVIRKQIQTGCKRTDEQTPAMENANAVVEQFDHMSSSSSSRKRKDTDTNREDDNASSSNKKRVVWTSDLHQKFLQAFHQIGSDKVGPKKILDLMGVEWLTRENVASHLQKYRLGLTKKESEQKSKSPLLGTRQPDSNVFSQEDLMVTGINYENVISPGPVILQPPYGSCYTVPSLVTAKQEFKPQHFMTQQHQLEQAYGNPIYNYVAKYPNNNPSSWQCPMNSGMMCQNSYEYPMRNLAQMAAEPSSEEQPSGAMRNLCGGEHTNDVYPYPVNFFPQDQQMFGMNSLGNIFTNMEDLPLEDFEGSYKPL